MAAAFPSAASSLLSKASDVLFGAVDAHVLTAVSVSLLLPFLILFCVNGKDGNDKVILKHSSSGSFFFRRDIVQENALQK